MEIAIVGAGEVLIRFIDRQGDTLLQERLVVSGPPDVRALRIVPLSLGTVDGPAEVAPVLASLSARQRVTFDGEGPASFVRRRCKEIGCSAAVTRRALRGSAPLPAPAAAGVATVVDPPMADVLRVASGRGRRRR
jgi:hypothetical protein